MSTRTTKSISDAATPPTIEASTEAAVVPGASAPIDTASLKTKALARAILAREVRPRVGDIRRLAEAVLKKKRKKGAEKSEPSPKRKLSKIPAKTPR